MAHELASELLSVCYKYGKTITGLTHGGQPVSGPRLLAAISGLESTFGVRREFVRAEKGYLPGGKYYSDSAEVRKLYRQYGVLAASSYGSWQIMFVTARELGFSGHPIQLQDDDICAFWATKLITERFIKRLKAQTLEHVLDCYNSGWHKDQFIPTEYISDGTDFYNELSNI